MFHEIRPAVRRRMEELEAIDRRDRSDGTPRLQRLRQIPPETGKLLALVASGAPDGAWLEIGASAGYSTLWLGLAAEARGVRLTTFEILPEKAALARETLRAAGMESVVELVADDARKRLADFPRIGFCFLDAEKEVYSDCYEAAVPRLVPGGWLAADNAVSHAEALRPFLDRAGNDPRVDALIVPVGKGVLLCRKV
jgi:caffeoyl-CoA O-methyltransferase